VQRLQVRIRRGIPEWVDTFRGNLPIPYIPVDIIGGNGIMRQKSQPKKYCKADNPAEPTGIALHMSAHGSGFIDDIGEQDACDGVDDDKRPYIGEELVAEEKGQVQRFKNDSENYNLTEIQTATKRYLKMV